jgi:hypothetical protein
MHTKFWSENLRVYLKVLGVDGNIRMDLQDIGLKGVDWIHVVQDRDQR